MRVCVRLCVCVCFPSMHHNACPVLPISEFVWVHIREGLLIMEAATFVCVCLCDHFSCKHTWFSQYGCQCALSIIIQCVCVCVDGKCQTRSLIRAGPLEPIALSLLQAEHKLLPQLQPHKLMYGYHLLTPPCPNKGFRFFSFLFQSCELIPTAQSSLLQKLSLL